MGRARRYLRAPAPCLLALVLAACDAGAGRAYAARGGGVAGEMPPAAEFLLAADDSSYWVRTGSGAGPDGVEVRRAPVVLALVSGRWHELYVTEQDFSFPDAVFTAQVLWRRDLITGDSVPVVADSTVPLMAAAYARAHPGELPLEPDEPEDEDPSTIASTEVALHDVHGPYASVELYADIHLPRGVGRHTLRRSVVELATGRRMPLSELLEGGRVAAGAVEESGRERLVATRDSARHLALQVDTAAAAALERFVLDPASFALTQVGGGAGVVFYAVGTGDAAEGFALPIEPIAVTASSWWAGARSALPDSTGAGIGSMGGSGGPAVTGARWGREALSVSAVSGALDGGPVDPFPAAPGEGTTLILHDARGLGWTLAHLGSVPRRLYWLDGRTAPGRDERLALARAFYRAGFADGVARATAGGRGTKSRPPARLRPVASTSTRSTQSIPISAR